MLNNLANKTSVKCHVLNMWQRIFLLSCREMVRLLIFRNGNLLRDYPARVSFGDQQLEEEEPKPEDENETTSNIKHIPRTIRVRYSVQVASSSRPSVSTAAVQFR